MIDLNLIQINDEDRLSFSHELFQEYFAAEQLVFLYEANPEELEKLWMDPNWKEPIIIFSGLVDSREEVIELILSKDLLLAAQCVYSSIKQEQALKDEIVREAAKAANHLADNP